MRPGVLTRCLVLAALGALIPTLPAAQDGLDVVKMVLAEPELDPGAEQLVQISLRNPSRRPLRAGLQLDVLTKSNRPTGIRHRRQLVVQAGAEVRAFFRLKAPRRPGKYTARLIVLTPDFKKALLPGAPRFFSPFTVVGVIPPPEAKDGAAKGAGGEGAEAPAPGRPSFKIKPGLEFEKADLIWENFIVRPSSLLVGEPIIIKAQLRNVGGDIARDIEIKATYFNTRLPKRVLPLTSSTVDVLAPGEKIELEYEFEFPKDALLGDYQIALLADATNKVVEANEKNNRKITETPIRLSTILLVFPERGFEFDQAGLFLFRWNSSKYNEFKVQVGTDPLFENKEDFFDLPQGEKWTQDQEIVPLTGELPGMLLGLMIKNSVRNAHWRVVGRVAGTDRIGFSLARQFTLQADLPEDEQQADRQEGGASATQGQEGGAAAAPRKGRSEGIPAAPLPPGGATGTGTGSGGAPARY